MTISIDAAPRVRLVPLLGSLALAVALSGASDALVALPRVAVGVFGLTCMLLGMLEQPRHHDCRLLVALGVVLGFAMPRALPPAAGAVITATPAGVHRGDLFALLDRLDADPQAVLGTRVNVSGAWMPASGAAAATVSRRVMVCCAADAFDAGFDVVPMRASTFVPGSVVRVSGVLIRTLRAGEMRYAIERATVTPLGLSLHAR